MLTPGRFTRITLEPYNPEWGRKFEAWRERLAQVLQRRAVSIDHFGSTAVPGLPSKPIIDVLVGRGTGETFEVWRRLLAPLGLTLAREDSTSQAEGQWFFRDADRTVYVHSYQHGSIGHRRHLGFRDVLLRDAALRQQYAELKQRLSEREWTSRQEYVDAKSEFVLRVEATFRTSSNAD